MDLTRLVTETRNPASKNIDRQSTTEILHVINEEDQKVAPAVAREIPNIARAVDMIVDALAAGGRLFYVGAGTSGRLGILDAAECPPTYGTSPELIQGCIAGGKDAVFRSVEGAEDDPALGRADLEQRNVTGKDVVVGLAASGRTPYVIGALEYARSVGAKTVAISCNPASPIAQMSDVPISPVVGPEVVTGSTRMKAGTAQKLVLNMLSTAAMIRLGKVYSNLMVDVQATNHKLRERAKSIIQEATGVSREEAATALTKAGGSAKLAIVMLRTGLDRDAAAQRLAAARGYVREAIAMGGEGQ